MTKLSVGAPVLLLLSALPAHAVQPIEVEPSTVNTPQAAVTPASAPAHATSDSTDTESGQKVTPAVRDKELSELQAANAQQLQTARAQIDANTRSREEADRANAEYQKQLEAVNAAKAKYDADMVIYNKRVAACEAGDRRGCLGQ